MKSANRFAAILLLFTSVLFINCTPNQDELGSTKEIITRGNWSVNYFFAGQDQTALLGEYSFTFHNDGTLSCLHNSSQCSGNWELARNVSGDVLRIDLDAPQAELKMLNEEWSVAGTDGHSVHLKNGASQLRIRKR